MKKEEETKKALEIAKYILQESNKELSNLELQKTLYFSQLDFYKKHKKFLIADDFEAWQYGPVSREVYNEYRHYGASSIEKPKEKIELELSDEEKDTIKRSVEQSNKKTYWKLVEESHCDDGAWKKTYDENKKKTIDKNHIKEEAERRGN